MYCVIKSSLSDIDYLVSQPEAFRQALVTHGFSGRVRTAFIERLNLTLRRSLANTCPPKAKRCGGDGSSLLEHGALHAGSGLSVRLVACDLPLR